MPLDNTLSMTQQVFTWHVTLRRDEAWNRHVYNHVGCVASHTGPRPPAPSPATVVPGDLPGEAAQGPAARPSAPTVAQGERPHPRPALSPAGLGRAQPVRASASRGEQAQR